MIELLPPSPPPSDCMRLSLSLSRSLSLSLSLSLSFSLARARARALILSVPFSTTYRAGTQLIRPTCNVNTPPLYTISDDVSDGPQSVFHEFRTSHAFFENLVCERS